MLPDYLDFDWHGNLRCTQCGSRAKDGVVRHRLNCSNHPIGHLIDLHVDQAVPNNSLDNTQWITRYWSQTGRSFRRPTRIWGYKQN